MLNKLKSFLREEIEIEADGNKLITVIPIIHNEDVVYLQFYGWSINLYPNGTYVIEATDGG